jgi:hypothetical protein
VAEIEAVLKFTGLIQGVSEWEGQGGWTAKSTHQTPYSGPKEETGKRWDEQDDNPSVMDMAKACKVDLQHERQYWKLAGRTDVGMKSFLEAVLRFGAGLAGRARRALCVRVLEAVHEVMLVLSTRNTARYRQRGMPQMEPDGAAKDMCSDCGRLAYALFTGGGCGGPAGEAAEMEAGIGNGLRRLTYRAALARDLGRWCSGAQGQHSCAIIQSEEERVKGLEGVRVRVPVTDTVGGVE